MRTRTGWCPIILAFPPEHFDLEPIAREPLPGARLRTRAFIKVQDGCDNRCTFCVTTLARGSGRSRPISAVLGDIQSAILGGAQEVVLTGVHLGSWGADLNDQGGLRNLVEAILFDTDVPRLRLSSLEPWDLDRSFFDLWENQRLCRHIHLPLQSGCAATLRRMARKTNPEAFASLVTAARKVVPQMAITTDIITGFPGETPEEFGESLDFVRAQGFAGGHVFTYSERPGTAAADLPAQVPHAIRKERNAVMREQFSAGAEVYRANFLGLELSTLWETATALGPDSWQLHGISDNYLRITAEAPRDFWNQITPIRITGLTENGLVGTFSIP